MASPSGWGFLVILSPEFNATVLDPLESASFPKLTFIGA
jgi:hypothetical protein